MEQQTAAALTCKHGCGYSHAHRGAMNIHERIHCKTLRKIEGEPDEMATKKAAAAEPETKKYKCCEAPDVIMMHKGDQRFTDALAAGYKKVCTNCVEVYK